MLKFSIIICLVGGIILSQWGDAASIEEGGGEVKGDRSRYARCFDSIWNWMTGYTRQTFEEKVISGDPDKIRFYLYPNPYKTDYFEEIVFGDVASLQRSNYRFGQPWKILIHGYTQSQYGAFPQNVKDGYLLEYQYRDQLERDSGNRQSTGFNVLLVDWGPLADPKFQGDLNFFLFYSFAVRNIPIVGQRVAEFILFLSRNGAFQTLDQVHVVGFSLGAHVAGSCGSAVYNMTGQKLSRVTGLDPAGPNFYLGLPRISTKKLAKTDAKFVDVYHSSKGTFGTLENLGDVDFYPNGGGPVQKYCVIKFTNNEENETITDVGSCSHNRGPYYFAQSISSIGGANMVACACDDYKSFKSGSCECKDRAIFGEYCDPTTRGIFYIDIKD